MRSTDIEYHRQQYLLENIQPIFRSFGFFIHGINREPKRLMGCCTCAGRVQVFLMLLLTKQSGITTIYTAFAFCYVLCIIRGWSEVPRGLCTGWIHVLHHGFLGVWTSTNLGICVVLGPICCGYWEIAVLCSVISKDARVISQIVITMSTLAWQLRRLNCPSWERISRLFNIDHAL